MAKPRRILVAPLDWGLGHATRCIPLIQGLLDWGQEVWMASSGGSIKLLKEEFPGLPALELTGYGIRYPKAGSLALSVLQQTPNLLRSIQREHRQLNEIIKKHKPDAVISDNRFGLWNTAIPTVFITHQVHIQPPRNFRWAAGPVNMLNRYFMSRFDECWIPDSATGSGLAGRLSHPGTHSTKTYYLGPLSRFRPLVSSGHPPLYDLCVILSGPEPQRSQWEESLVTPLKESGKKVLVVRGLPGAPPVSMNDGKMKVVSSLSSDSLQQAIQSSEMLISRAGYSSIMDYVALGKDAILVPTPGQTEQEYLADEFKKKKIFYSVAQKNFNLSEALQASRNYSVKNLVAQETPDLKKHLENWLERISSC